MKEDVIERAKTSERSSKRRRSEMSCKRKTGGKEKERRKVMRRETCGGEGS